jgi:UPF0755 protein
MRDSRGNRKPAKSSRAFLTVFLLIFTIALGAVGGSMALFALSPANTGPATKQLVEIHKGEGPIDIAKTLAAAGAVSDTQKFMWLGKLTRQWKKLKAGEYEVSTGMTPMDVFGVITSGISVVHPITVREGENMYDIAADIEKNKLAPKARILALCRDPKLIAALGLKTEGANSLEGYLFPDTYHFNRAMSPEEMVRAMVRRFLGTWTQNEDNRASLLGMSRHQVLTLASMIEKETGAPKERPMISSVFHNRLQKKMKLQSDPTTIYGMWDKYQGDRNIHRSDLLAPSAYNTYTLPGLPVGPIGNPGTEAVQAALNPLESQYIFFVSHNDGTHEFTSTLEDHNKAVRQFQLNPAARAGKSWRDLKKNAAASRP